PPLPRRIPVRRRRADAAGARRRGPAAATRRRSPARRPARRACRRICPDRSAPAWRAVWQATTRAITAAPGCGTMGGVTTSWVEPSSTATALLLLGRGSDPDTERGVECPGALPPPSDPDLVARAAAAKAALGDRVFILGHHYQRDEVIQFADVTGDSF